VIVSHTLGRKRTVFYLYDKKYVSFNSYAPELVPVFYYRDKTPIQMVYFLNLTNFISIREYIDVNFLVSL